jgi:hypothetical protein
MVVGSVGAGEVWSGVLHGEVFGADRHSRRGGSGGDVRWGRLRRPGRGGKAYTGPGRGRRTTQGVSTHLHTTPPLRFLRGFLASPAHVRFG